MITALKEDKIILSVIGILVISLLGWGTWVTVDLFAQEMLIAVLEKDRQSLREDMGEIKGEIREVKKDLSKATEKINDNQAEMLIILLDIKKEARRKAGAGG